MGLWPFRLSFYHRFQYDHSVLHNTLLTILIWNIIINIKLIRQQINSWIEQFFSSLDNSILHFGSLLFLTFPFVWQFHQISYDWTIKIKHTRIIDTKAWAWRKQSRPTKLQTWVRFDLLNFLFCHWNCHNAYCYGQTIQKVWIDCSDWLRIHVLNLRMGMETLLKISRFSQQSFKTQSFDHFGDYGCLWSIQQNQYNKVCLHQFSVFSFTVLSLCDCLWLY